MVNNVSRNQNMSEPNSIPNQSMQNEQVMAQNAQSNLGQQANAQSMPAQDQVDFASLFGQTNLSSQNEQTSNTSFEDLRAEEESNISQNTQTDDGKVYDENGYEVVDLTGAKKSKKNKKKEKKSKDNQLNNLETQNYFNQSNSNAETEVVKSSKGMKIFAFVELFLLIISVVVIGYLTLGQYIMTDPCQRTWKEYQNAEKLRVSEEGFKEIEIIKALVSEDGTYAIYKVKGEGNNNVVIFKIEKGFSISTFFDMSTAKIYGFAAEQDIAKEMLPDVKWQDNK